MNILTEIIEVSDEMIDNLIEQNFFNDTPFVSPLELKRGIQKQMQYNWEQTNEMYLDEDQFLEICREIISEGISHNLGVLIDNGYVEMAVNPEGEIVYSLTDKEFDL